MLKLHLKLHLSSRLLNLILPIVLIACFTEPAFCQQPLVIFLVRHAEKVDSSEKSELSDSGTLRAETLATTLLDANVDFVHSTDFIRTKKTAAPIAAKRDVKVDLYDGGKLPALVEQLKSKGGRHLIVGHSNTTPKLVELLGGQAGAKIQENEYDRLYIVTIGADGVASTVLIKFGAPFVPKAEK